MGSGSTSKLSRVDNVDARRRTADGGRESWESSDDVASERDSDALLASGSVFLAVNPDSNDCTSRNRRGAGRYSDAGLREGESKDMPSPNGCTTMDSGADPEEFTGRSFQCMTSPKMSPVRGTATSTVMKRGISAAVTLCECWRAGGGVGFSDEEIEEPLVAISEIERVLRSLRGALL